MDFTIFYSWQSDTDTDLNRSFIERALNEAITGIVEQRTLPAVPIIDLGMLRTPGSPEVATVMFRKIRRSAVILCDVTLVGKIAIPGKEPKKTANPNVMIEMGYAAAYLGWERVLCVMNEHFGAAEEQPVDVRNRRFPIDYTLTPNKENIDSTKKQLVKDIKRAIEGVWTYDLDTANEAKASLDVNCLILYGIFGDRPYFSAGDPQEPVAGGALNSQNFSTAVMRLLDLKLIYSDVDRSQGRYAYHWTYLGLKVAELLGASFRTCRLVNGLAWELHGE